MITLSLPPLPYGYRWHLTTPDLNSSEGGLYLKWNHDVVASRSVDLDAAPRSINDAAFDIYASVLDVIRDDETWQDKERYYGRLADKVNGTEW